MKRLMKMMSDFARPLALLLVTAILFTACKKDDTGFEQLRVPAAGLMAFNLAPDKVAVGFTLSNNPLPNAVLNYTEFTGVYLPIYPGSRELRAVDYFTGSTIATITGSFTDSMYYSAFVVGYNGSYKNVLVQDDLNGLASTAGKAWVRYINAISDSTATPLVNIDDGAVTAPAPYATVSSFVQVDAGAVSVSVSNGSNINASRTITLEANKIYTVLLVGMPGATEAGKEVQVRFITNGTITE